jgi:hypothetical protein
MVRFRLLTDWLYPHIPSQAERRFRNRATEQFLTGLQPEAFAAAGLKGSEHPVRHSPVVPTGCPPIDPLASPEFLLQVEPNPVSPRFLC